MREAPAASAAKKKKKTHRGKRVRGGIAYISSSTPTQPSHFYSHPSCATARLFCRGDRRDESVGSVDAGWQRRTDVMHLCWENPHSFIMCVNKMTEARFVKWGDLFTWAAKGTGAGGGGLQKLDYILASHKTPTRDPLVNDCTAQPNNKKQASGELPLFLFNKSNID